MLGSLMFTFCGFNLLHFVHPNAVAVIAHIPWLLWAIDIVLADARWSKVAGPRPAIALLTGSQLLLGYPQYIWFSLLAEASYAAVRHRTRRRRSPRRGCASGASCLECVGCGDADLAAADPGQGAGVLLGGVQLWPTFDALRHSTRQAADAAFAQVGSVHPAEPGPTGRPVLVHRPRAGRRHPRDESLRGRGAADADRLAGDPAAATRPACARLARATAWFGRLRPGVGHGTIRLPLQAASLRAAVGSLPLPLPLSGPVPPGAWPCWRPWASCCWNGPISEPRGQGRPAPTRSTPASAKDLRSPGEVRGALGRGRRRRRGGAGRSAAATPPLHRLARRACWPGRCCLSSRRCW